MDFLTSFLGRGGYLPHGYCFVWTPGLLWTMVIADAVIALAYFSIPIALLSFILRRGSLPMQWVAWLFSAFIFACGITHLMDIWTIWQPDYGLQALTKVVTAVLSLVTAIGLWPLIPKALKIPSVDALQGVIGSLEAEVRRRRSAEEQLVEIQQSLALTLTSIGAGFIATDREGRVTRMNAVAEQVMGWTQVEAQGQNFWTVFKREDRPAHYLEKTAVNLLVEKKMTVDTVHHLVAISRDGARTALEVKAAPTRTVDGMVTGLAMVFRDMTLLLRAQTESSRLVAIVESSNDAIIGRTLEGQITNWNGSAEPIFGYSAAEAIGQPVQILIPPECQSEERRMVAELAQGIKVAPFDTLRKTKDGRYLQVSISISPIRDELGLIVGTSSIVRDVSQQRHAEAALRGSKARLRFTLDAAQIGDWKLNLTAKVVEGSLQFSRCFGYDELQNQWSLDTFVQHVHPEDKHAVTRSFNNAIAHFSDLQLECRVVWPDASIHWLSLHGNLESDPTKPLCMLGIVTDITQQRLAEEARIKTQRLEVESLQMREASRLKTQFMANMSHELRTPLNAVIGFARLLETGAVTSESPKYRKFLANISTSGRHLLQLINDVLDLSKVESGTFGFSPEPLMLPATLKEVTDVLQSALDSKNICISVEIDPTVTDLSLDVSRFKQVLYNLLSNAIKFTPSGGQVMVRVLAQGAEHFRLEVEDTGIGIAPTDLPRLFIEFQQLDAGYSKQHQGTGLGLALTRRLIEAQGGTVGVNSTVGVGSVFHIFLNRIHGTDTLRAAVKPQHNANSQLIKTFEGVAAAAPQLGIGLTGATL